MSRGDTTAPMRRYPPVKRRSYEMTRPEVRAACALLADIMTLLDEPQLADVCLRALDGHFNEQVRAGSALVNAMRLLSPEMPRGSEP